MQKHAALKTGILLSILAAVAQMAHAVNATGGTITTNNGNRIHTFTNSGTFAVTEAGNMDLLIVAGGGGGAPPNGNGGGGGAGGLIYTNTFIGAGTNAVTIGAGGGAGANGSNTILGSLTAIGGGGGGPNGGNGLPGGSGGGGGQVSNGGAGTPGQGYAGGNHYGGGGGAGAIGGTGSGGGGNGTQLSISGTAQWYAGGGGGAGGGSGGLGGGGSSLVSGHAGTAGTNGLGGGGGGGWSSSGGVGGSGIVIVSYPLDLTVGNLAPTNIVSGAACLNGQVMTGINITNVSVYWGPVDGGTNAALWANTNVFSGGPWNMGGVLTTNMALTPGQDYFYTYCASNALGSVMAAPSQYFMDGALTLAATTASFGSTPTSTGTVVVSRPSNCTNGPLTVYYTLGGTLTNGVNYSASPASGALVIPAGQTSASITLTPLQYNYGVVGSITVNLSSGAYVIGSPSTANCTLQKWTVMTTPATGGIITTNVTSNGTYLVHTFTNSGAFTATSPGNVLVLVVAGGGGGAPPYGSGGGAGGLIYTNTFISAGANAVTIGVGGAGANGSNTIFGSLTAIGGGGGSSNPGNGNAGGSGGGGYSTAGVGGSGLQPSSASGGYGNNGGNGPGGAGGGGGGAGAASVNGTGIGANGRPFSICGTGTVYYAGGGSGAGCTNSSLGGGGASISGAASQSGAANSGGGGGGGWGGGGAGGKGGSGIVIVSYPISSLSSGTVIYLR